MLPFVGRAIPALAGVVLGVTAASTAIAGHVFPSIVLFLASILFPVALATWNVKVFPPGTKRGKRTNLFGHYIVCGPDEIASRVASQLRRLEISCAVLTTRPLARQLRRAASVLAGSNPPGEEALHAAGLLRARGLIVACESEANTAHVTSAARAARPDLLIVAVGDGAAERTFLRAGADHVVRRAAAVSEALEIVCRDARADRLHTRGSEEHALYLTDVEVTTGSGAAGKTLGELRAEGRHSALLLGARKDGLGATASFDALLEPGDVVIAAGTPRELALVETLLGRSSFLDA